MLTHSHSEQTHSHLEQTHSHSEQTHGHLEQTHGHFVQTHSHSEQTHRHSEQTHRQLLLRKTVIAIAINKSNITNKIYYITILIKLLAITIFYTAIIII